MNMIELEQMRREWVDVTRKNGFREGITDLLAHQYSKKTHFIFELLQNAEDARATEVEFRVESQHLVFSHNGDRLFSDENVESITSIGKSTKQGDYTQIGKHGIGFKAVFAYTHTPRIHSGDKHFDIEDVVIPCFLTGDDVPTDLKPEETRIILPFDSAAIPEVRRFRELVSAETAKADISEALKKLNIRTLLLLRHIEEIRWTLFDGTKGAYLRESKSEPDRISLRHVDVTDGDRTESWFVFEQEANITDDGKDNKCIVEVAFLVENGKVVPARNTELVVYFPTEKKTGLAFLIQGPFKTTKARDNIKSDDANRQMLETAAHLAADSLETLRDLDLLELSSYLALPLVVPEDSFFRPVYDQVRKALSKKALLPANGGGFIKAEEAKLARGKELAELFSTEQLGFLFGKENLSWLEASITESGAMAGLHTYLVGRKKYQSSKDWEIEPLWDGLLVDADTLVPKLTAAFLGRQALTWLVKFIQYVMQPKSSSALKQTPFIRLVSGKQVSSPVNNDVPRPAWFAPKDDAGLDLTVFSIVHPDLADSEDIRKFLEKEGIREIDAVAIVEKSVLPKYRESNPCFDESTYRVDLRRICEAYSKANDAERIQLIASLRKFAWLACVHASSRIPDKIVWKKPGASDLFEKTADHETWLHGLEDVDAYFLHSSIIEILNETVTCLAETTATLFVNLSMDEYTINLSDRYKYKCGLKGFNPNATIIGIKCALAQWNQERSKILWRALLLCPSRIISGETQFSRNHQKLKKAPKEIEYSEVGELCRNQAWLFDKLGNWHKPSQLLLTDLPEGFESTSMAAKEVAEKLGMKQDVVAKLAEQVGVRPEDIELLKQHPEEFQRWKADIAARDAKPVFPTRTVSNPERRQERLTEQLAETPEKGYEPRVRSVRTTEATPYTRIWLRNQYTNDAGQMICQICKKEMPFKKRDGEYYFEAVEALSKEYFSREHEAQFLALCPLCAAIYREFVRLDESAAKVLYYILKNLEEPEVPLKLGEIETTVRFVESHWQDMRTILTYQGDEVNH
ncbi:MAG: hypothetical protein C0392_11275 [Syntrophus sp. (in: bacteria)]|nr:hypothetical protein [Syntrophus sp. (in: bacteria)]